MRPPYRSARDTVRAAVSGNCNVQNGQYGGFSFEFEQIGPEPVLVSVSW